MTKSEFCKGLTWKVGGIKWLDLTGMKRLARNRVAKIEVVVLGRGDHYEALRVQVINRDSGVVDEKVFRFRDYLDYSNRSDERPYKNPDGYVVISRRHDDFEWYIAIPKDTRPLCEAVETYLKFFEKAL